MFTGITPARLTLTIDGTPWSETFQDVYHSADGGLGQARHVFLGGNDLPARWRDRRHFVIVETGFGLGLNFLATWAAWREDPRRPRCLHFVSVEKNPFHADDLLRAHERWGELQPLARQLVDAWPVLMPGFHRLHFEAGRVTLTLLFGDALDMLRQLSARADAFYLDGFAPTANPDMWSAPLFGQVRRLAAPGASCATWSVAALVREGLAAAGFMTEKCPGFGQKREMLRGRLRVEAHWDGTAQTAHGAARQAIVIGAGLAGTAAAERLAARDWNVTLVERGSAPAQGASGNRQGVLRPLPNLDDNRLARLIRAGFLYARRHLDALGAENLPVRWAPCGVLHLAREPKHEALQRRLVAEQMPPPEYLQFLEREAAVRLAGWPVEAGGWWFPTGGWVSPPSLCAANLGRHAGRIDARFGVSVGRIERRADTWLLLDHADRPIAEAPTVILANGAAAAELEQTAALPLRTALGQATYLPVDATPTLDIVVCRLGYVTPALDGIRCAGATFDTAATEAVVTATAHQENLARLHYMLPGFAANIGADRLQGRASLRPLSPDRLPMIGALPRGGEVPRSHEGLDDLPRLPGLFGLLGYGARGLVWAQLAAELLASQLEGDPLPLEADLVAAVDPARFLLRAWRRGIPLSDRGTGSAPSPSKL
jgi:tRNA 5-methylaminomethyl-2-thiouridine biosynthesis bifunctional protein